MVQSSLINKDILVRQDSSRTLRLAPRSKGKWPNDLGGKVNLLLYSIKTCHFCHVMSLDLTETSALGGFIQHFSSRGKGGLVLWLLAGGRSSSSPLSFHWHPRGEVLVTLWWQWAFWLTCGLHWHRVMVASLILNDCGNPGFLLGLTLPG